MFSISQKFFVSRLLELLHRETIDSYRVRVLNPYSALRETLHVYQDFVKGSVKSFETLSACIDEVIYLLKDDQTIIFDSFSKDFFVQEVLKKVRKENAAEIFNTVSIAFSEIFKSNSNYAKRLTGSLSEAINTPLGQDPFRQLDAIYNLTGMLATELISLGFDKGFLYPKCHSIFLRNNQIDFESAFGEFSKLIDSPGNEYQVWFKVYASKLASDDWPAFPNWEIKTSLSDLLPNPKSRMNSFLTEKRSHFFTGTQIHALDHFAALRRCKQQLSEIIDLASLAHHQSKIELQALALVHPVGKTHLAGLHQVKHIHDGKFPSGEGVLNQLQEKTPAILENEKIAPETKEKIKSALRYLRFGNEAFELEHQLINYWVGLEYLFSNDRDSTFSRIKTIFPILQGAVYLIRNLIDFHGALLGIDEIKAIDAFQPDDFSCLLDKICLEKIRDEIYAEHPLLSYRAWKVLNRLIREKNGAKNYIHRHKTHLEWHLARIYRIRNTIVHEAKYSINNQTLASNLRYYLAFSLSMIIEFFSKSDLEVGDMEEFFSLYELRYKSLEHQSFPLDLLLKQEISFGLLS